MRTIKRDIVAAIIFSKDEKIFIGKKHPTGGGVYVDSWHIPGGGLEEGESKLDALIREIKEETSIDISKYDVALIDDCGRGVSQKTLKSGEIVNCKMHFFVYKVLIQDKSSEEIEIKLDDDLEKFQWVKASRLKEIKLTPPSVELFGRLGLI